MQDQEFTRSRKAFRWHLHWVNGGNIHSETSENRLQQFVFEAALWILGQIFQFFRNALINPVPFPLTIMYSADVHIFAHIQSLFQYELSVIINRIVGSLFCMPVEIFLNSWIYEKEDSCRSFFAVLSRMASLFEALPLTWTSSIFSKSAFLTELLLSLKSFMHFSNKQFFIGKVIFVHCLILFQIPFLACCRPFKCSFRFPSFFDFVDITFNNKVKPSPLDCGRWEGCRYITLFLSSVFCPLHHYHLFNLVLKILRIWNCENRLL